MEGRSGSGGTLEPCGPRLRRVIAELYKKRFNWSNDVFQVERTKLIKL
jgi:hypothetical protein